MYSGKDAPNPSYPTQWALNPSAYQNIDSNHVDWAALAQQWIAMKEAAVIVSAPAPPPPKIDIEEGEAPMEVENPDTNNDGSGDWNSNSNTWNSGWNEWGWGWSGTGPVEPKINSEPSMTIPPMLDSYPVANDVTTTMPGYTSAGTVQTSTFQHGYWTAPQTDQIGNQNNNQDRRSKSKNRDKITRPRQPREKGPILPPVIEPIPMMPAPGVTATIDAAKRRQLPAWIREGLEKMEREKQKAIEREQENKVREEAEKEKKKLEEQELERLKAEAAGQPFLPPKSKFESDSEGENSDKEERSDSPRTVKEETDDQRLKSDTETLGIKSKEEIMQEVMLAVRRSLTEILLEVTDLEVVTVAREEVARYAAAQATRLNAMKAGKSKAFAAIATGLGLAAYESSSDDSDADDHPDDLTDHQLQEIIKRKRLEFERTSRDIEAEVRRAELREEGERSPESSVASPATPRTPAQPATPHDNPATPEHSRASDTPPPAEAERSDVSDRRVARDKRSHQKTSDKIDGVRKVDSVPEEKHRKSSKRHSTSPQRANHRAHSASSYDSEEDSSSSESKSSESERGGRDRREKKKRRRSSSIDSRRKSKKKKEKSHKNSKESKSKESKETKSRHTNEYEREKSRRKKDDYYKSKSSRRDYERSHRDRHREERSKSRRSRSASRESRHVSHESRYETPRYKYDRYERGGTHSRRRSRTRSRSRHRRAH